MANKYLIATAAAIAVTVSYTAWEFAIDGSLGLTAGVIIGLLTSVTGAFLVSWRASLTRIRSTVDAAWLAVSSVLLSYVLADVVCGVFLIERLSPPTESDPFTHHRLRANTHSRFHNDEFSYVQRVNNLGVRGKDVAVEKDPGAFRILMLGDSFTMGKGVSDEQTFSAQLEAALRASSTPGAEVINAGVDSYAPILSLLQLRTQLSELDADLVVLNLDPSDLVLRCASEVGVIGFRLYV